MRRALCLLLLLLLLCPAARAQSPKGEEQLVIYTSHKPEVYEPIIREFESRTGLWVRLESGGTTEMLEKIALESENPICDLMFGGGVESLEAYSAYFVNDPLGGGAIERTWLPFSSLPMVLVYNPKLTGAPDGWHDLLEGRYTGRIAFADPSVSGSSYTALATLLQAFPGEDVLPALIENLGGLVLEGSGDVIPAVADGQCLIGVTLEETALKAQAAGYDIGMVYPSEGTSAVPDGAAMIAGCAHPDGARLFLSFILCDDVQSRLPATFSRRSVLDEPAGILLIDYDVAWASAQKSAVLQQWAALIEKGGERE